MRGPGGADQAPGGRLLLVLSEHVGAAGEKRRIHGGSTSLSATLLKLHRTAAFSAVLAANRNAASDLLHPAVGEMQVPDRSRCGFRFGCAAGISAAREEPARGGGGGVSPNCSFRFPLATSALVRTR
jgi:hypothetical protein